MSADKAKTKNKGEVSEFYAFVHVLQCGQIPLVDGKLKQIGGKTLDFYWVFRKEEKDKVTKKETFNEYDLKADPNRIKVVKSGQVIGYVDKTILGGLDSKLLKLIQTTKGKIEDAHPILTDLKTKLYTKNLSAKASDKSDFSGAVLSQDIPVIQRLGFSVKSHLGSEPTLINASEENSAFRFEVLRNGKEFSSQEVKELVSLSMDEASKEIRQGNVELKFSRALGANLDYNLRLIDTFGPELVASLLCESFTQEIPLSTNLAKIIDMICENDRASKYPVIQGLGATKKDRVSMLSFKLKSILLAFATGATVSTKWDGKDDATGGFLVVTKEGKVVCLELFTRNAIGDYLLDWTRFERPSRTRHHYGMFVEGNGKVYFDLQLQVRFKDKQ